MHHRPSSFLVVACAAHAARAAVPVPPALLINLPKHTERFKTVTAVFDSANIRYERAEAVDGRALSDEELKANVTFMARHFCTPGMIGCYLSHRNCWRRCVEAAQGPMLVFEDDVVLSNNFTQQLQAAIADLPPDWDVLVVGALGAIHPNYYFFNAGHALVAGGMRWPRGSRKAFKEAGRDDAVAIHTPLRPFGTHAYLISEVGARKLLAAAPRASYHVDVIAWGMRKLNLYAVHPLLAKQTHGDTTIGGHNDRSWLPEIVIDRYTGTDFAWAWNSPIMRFGLPFGKRLLLTFGRCFTTALGTMSLAWALKSWKLFYASCGFIVTIYSILTGLMWPQQRVTAAEWAAMGSSSSSSSSDAAAAGEALESGAPATGGVPAVAA